MKLVVGLGNPGRSYAGNRHNIGFMCLNHFARTRGIKFDKKQGRARTGLGEVGGIRVVLAKPQTYMNESGESVSRLVKRLNIGTGDLIVVHDDLDLPLGKTRIRRGGGSGGHKGIASVISCLETQDFTRLRVGIGRPDMPASSENGEADIIDYVLGDFTPDEKRVMAGVIPGVSDAIYCLLTEGLAAAMSKYN